jgi:DNA-binding FrmR family transcriptional regulator
MTGQSIAAVSTGPSHSEISDPVRRDLVRRLSRIRGQVEGIRRMVDGGRRCPEIMQQIAAVRSALRSAEKVILDEFVAGSVALAQEEGLEESAQVRQEMLTLIFRYLRGA